MASFTTVNTIILLINLQGRATSPLLGEVMNTNIKITLTDEQRDHIKNLIDGKITRKKATRADVSNLVQMFVDNLMESKLTEPQEIVQETIYNLSGYKFFVKGSKVEAKEWVEFSCDDCGCMVSVADNKLKNFPEDQTGLGHFWQDTLPRNFSWGA